MLIQGLESSALVGGPNPAMLVSRGADGLYMRLRDHEAHSAEQDSAMLQLRSHSALHNFYRTRDGELEYDLKLLRRPESNVFIFDLEFSPGVRLYRQPALTADEIRSGKSRPERVIGSYAVYGPAGKIGHLFRPLLIDARGDTSWGTLCRRGNTIDLVADPLWLYGAKYPVTVDPTIGLSTAGATRDAGAGDYAICTVFTAPSTGTTPATYNVWMDNTDTGTHDWVGAVYAISGGSPASQSRLATFTAQTIAANTNVATKQSASITWTPITGSTQYGLTFNMPGVGADLAVYYDSTTGSMYYATNTYTGSLPATFDAGPSNTTSTYSVSVDYTTSGGGGSRPHSLALLGVGY